MEGFLLYVCDFRTEETDCLQKEVVSNQPTNISFKMILAGILPGMIPSETLSYTKNKFSSFLYNQKKLEKDKICLNLRVMNTP